MSSREETAVKNLSRAFLQFPYLYRYGKKAHHAPGGSCCNLRPSDVMMLFAIKGEQKQGSVTATRLSADMGIKTPSINVVLSSLERKGLILRTTDPKDRRFVQIALSEEGEAKVEMFRRCFGCRVQGLVAYLGVEKSNLLAELMNEVYQYLRRKSGRPSEQESK